MRCTSRPRPRWLVHAASAVALALAITGSGCAAASQPTSDRQLVAETGRATNTSDLQSPAVLIPDGPGGSLIDVLPDGTRRLVVAGMRIVERPDGAVERAREVLPSGTTRVVTLPARLGGGLLVYVVTGGSTQVWRTSSWLAELEPVAELFGVVGEMVAGFDRVYARLLGADSGGDLKAFDPLTGGQVALGPLPPATRLGALAFADGWRAMVLSDFRGPLATFDAGNTWRTVPTAGRSVQQLGSRDGALVVETGQGRYVLRGSGELAADDGPEVAPLPPLWGTESARRASSVASARPTARADMRALASRRRPLRAAVEDGWPYRADDSGPGAVFAEAGALYRVALPSGRIEQVRARAFSDEFATCHAIQLGAAFGFLCGEARSTTAIYRFEPPFDVREIARFAEPRVLVGNGAGGWAVRGACERGAGAAAEGFCFVDGHGAQRDVRVDALPGHLRRDLRAVVLTDGRPLLIAPPAPGFAGALLSIAKRGFTAVPLELGEASAAVSRGRLLEGLEAREDGSIGGWLLIGQELHGVRIALDGRVTLHPASAHVERSVVAGRYAFDWGRGGKGAESVDGGATWSPVNVPAFDATRPLRDVAGCTPVGCARHGWLRVGWGAVPGRAELTPAPTPRPSKVSLTPPRGVALRCEPTGEVAGPAVSRASPPARSPAPPPPVLHPSTRSLPQPAPGASARAASTGATGVGASPWPWSAFRGVTPPALAPGETGVQAGTEPPLTTQARLYAWGARGGDWARAGRWLGRFDDRFAIRGEHSTASSPSMWADVEQAADALGVSAGQAVSWSALLDPAGDAVVLVAQRGGGRVDLYVAAEGEPPLQLRSGSDSALPVPNSVVRVGTTWYLLSTSSANHVWSSTVYTVEGAVVRPLVQLPRVPVPLGEMPPRLMRRTDSATAGILVLGAPGFGQAVRDWYVLPIDREQKALSDPVRLVGSDLEGRAPAVCAPHHDGWLVNTDLSLAPAVRVVGHESVSLSGIELRLRLEPGAACVEALAARFDGWLSFPRAQQRQSARPVAGRVPLVATHPESGRRWMLRCE